MPNNLCLTVAQRRIRDYTDESDRLMRAHTQAMGCWKCQEFLQSGINAFRWLKNAEEFLREADAQGVMEFNSELQDAVEGLYRAWTGPCEFAERWIAENQQMGFEINNLREFRQTCEEVQETIQNREWRAGSRRARILIASEEPE